MFTPVTSAELKRFLAKQGAVFKPGKGSHLHVTLNGRFTVMPVHGGGRELATGTVRKILKDLGLKGPK
jgi:mRNA interferase HicA